MISEEIINKMFNEIPNFLVNHQIRSYNDFVETGIHNIFRENNPITILKDQDPITGEFNLRCDLYLGGKDGKKIYYGTPTIVDNNKESFMYPNIARLRNMSYAFTIHYDVDVEFYMNDQSQKGIKNDELDTDEIKSHNTKLEKTEKDNPTQSIVLPRIYLGKIPIMLYSDKCLLRNLAPMVRFELGECKNDHGGYFIVDGKEKVIVSQESFADNMLYIRQDISSVYSHGADIRTVSQDASKPVRTLSIRIIKEGYQDLTNKNIVVILPNVRKPIPLFIVMRALGIISDKNIIQYCLLDLEKYSTYIDLFIPSIHDAGTIFTQEIALKYIASFTKHKTIPHALDILTNYFLPNIGEMNFIDKAYFLGYMVKELLDVYTNNKQPTDRDSFRYKRIETPGMLLYSLFREYLLLEQKSIYQRIDKEYTYKQSLYKNNFVGLITQNYREFFSDRKIDVGIRKAFKGNWGASTHTKKLGIVQSLNRLSYNSALAHLRKIILPLDDSAKIVKPRLLHSSQWGIIDPVDTPDGGNVGLHKHLAISAIITTDTSSTDMLDWLKRNDLMQSISYLIPLDLSNKIKILLNGAWVGISTDPNKLVLSFKIYRRLGLIPLYNSIYWEIGTNTIYIYTDAGRITRPIFYVDAITKTPSYLRDQDQLEKLNWQELTTGNNKKVIQYLNHKYYTHKELYNEQDISKLVNNSAIVEYIDTSESEGLLITNELDLDIDEYKKYTNIEIHPSFLLGILGNQVIFPENNPLPRNLFACGQMKQALSLYHSNYQNRIDKMGVILNNGQIPLVKSLYLNKINKEQHPYGENVICAIMCYGGYNVEDSILFNKGSLDRGLFRTTYFNSYEAYEESSNVGNSTTDIKFANINKTKPTGLKFGYDYSLLDEDGLIRENTQLTEKTILIGKVIENNSEIGEYIDSSIAPKKGQKGFVDKAVITEGEEGYRIAKVRVRDDRTPAIGDKFCSRCGQKGTIGLVIPECDMPFTKSGIRPDIIINPHALPSRMTIGQLIETVMGKSCSLLGGYGNCTAFLNKGQKATEFGKILTKFGFHSSGNEILYNGESGDSIVSDIFIGPTYYMRLKHMVKDKINARAKGPRTVLTRQTVQGRANEGGLRIGEMERDGVAGHGAMHFLQESMLVRGDEYYIAICNKSGMMAIYNESKDLFLSLSADGPIQFNGTLDNNLNIENVSKFGKSFSILRVPYAFKLLMQELTTMNVQMRLITEESINHLDNLEFSRNITSIKDLHIRQSKQIRKSIDSKNRDIILKAWKFIGNTPTDGDIYHSIIINSDNKPSEIWNTKQHNNNVPDRFPLLWNPNDLNNIDTKQLISRLIVDTEPNNWYRNIKTLQDQVPQQSSQQTPPQQEKDTSQQEKDTPNIPILDTSELNIIAKQRQNTVKSIQKDPSIQDNTLDNVPILEDSNISNINISDSPEQSSPEQSSPEQSSPEQGSPEQSSSEQSTSITDTKKKITVDTSALSN